MPETKDQNQEEQPRDQGEEQKTNQDVQAQENEDKKKKIKYIALAAVIAGLIVTALLIFLGYLLVSSLGNIGGSRPESGERSQAEDRRDPIQTPASLTTLNQIGTRRAALQFIGDKFELTTVRVTEVTGDRTFLATEHSEGPFAARLNDAAGGSGDGARGVRLTGGQTYDLKGTLRELPESLDEVRKQFNLTEAQARQVQELGVFLDVTQYTAVEPSPISEP